MEYVPWTSFTGCLRHWPQTVSANHNKFTNFSFNGVEFVRLVEQATEHVQKDKEFRTFVLQNVNNKWITTKPHSDIMALILSILSRVQ